jgi:hypothetical protein
MTGREIRTLNGEFGGGNGLSLDVVKELQVITNGFKAETGQTGAGTIRIVSRSGTNTLAGSAYGFWQPRASPAWTPTATAFHRTGVTAIGRRAWPVIHSAIRQRSRSMRASRTRSRSRARDGSRSGSTRST